MIIANIYEYQGKRYLITDVRFKTYSDPMGYDNSKVDGLVLSCVDKDDFGYTGKKIYADPDTFYRYAKVVSGAFLKVGEE